ncbi:zona pellucida-binding protein 1 isoform X4 [Camelus dromedarius]|uniref:zona pellucida-binding protein 1 isoform X4 n=1 Tax=Camelus dromedarius TaxID=9838 RepID=UPI0031194744
MKVYVLLHRKSPHVLCVTQQLRNSELVDPSFQWHGPKGKIVSENSTTQITSTGSLVFQNFEESMSGVYTCFLQYKPTVEAVVRNLPLKYVIYAYREPHSYYQFTARYHAAPCNSIYNISFEKKLLQILSKLVLDLSCEVSLLKSECHRVKMQRAGLQNELFFTFSVSSVDTDKGPKPCTGHNCESSKRLAKAKNLIERFFNQQVEVVGRRAESLPEIYHIEGTLQMVWINRCFPGFGINVLKHPKCPECCEICSRRLTAKTATQSKEIITVTQKNSVDFWRAGWKYEQRGTQRDSEAVAAFHVWPESSPDRCSVLTFITRYIHVSFFFFLCVTFHSKKVKNLNLPLKLEHCNTEGILKKNKRSQVFISPTFRHFLCVWLSPDLCLHEFTTLTEPSINGSQER